MDRRKPELIEGVSSAINDAGGSQPKVWGVSESYTHDNFGRPPDVAHIDIDMHPKPATIRTLDGPTNRTSCGGLLIGLATSGVLSGAAITHCLRMSVYYLERCPGSIDHQLSI